MNKMGVGSWSWSPGPGLYNVTGWSVVQFEEMSTFKVFLFVTL